MNMLKNGSMAIMPEFQFQPNNRGTYITGGTSLDFKLAKLRNEMVSFVYYRNVGISWSLCGPFPSNRSCSANIDSWYTFWMNEYLWQDKAQSTLTFKSPHTPMSVIWTLNGYEDFVRKCMSRLPFYHLREWMIHREVDVIMIKLVNQEQAHQKDNDLKERWTFFLKIM